jgi:hypothetical protein
MAPDGVEQGHGIDPVHEGGHDQGGGHDHQGGHRDEQGTRRS